MASRNPIQALLLLVILIIACYVTYKVASTPGGGIASLSTDAPADNLFDIKGFSVSNFSGPDLIYRIGADEFKIAPRKFSIFKIRIYNQAHLQNAHIEGYLSASHERLQMFPLKQLGTANQALCDGFQVDIYRDGKYLFNVTAERGKTDLIHKRTSLQKAIITYLPSAEKIASRSIIWDEKAQNFIIPGSFLKGTRTGRSIGKAIRIDLFNHQTPMGGQTSE